VNHWWNVPLYVSARGLTTTAMPYGEIFFEMEFDFVDHKLDITCSHGQSKSIALVPKSVAAFYRETMDAHREADIGLDRRQLAADRQQPLLVGDHHRHPDRQWRERLAFPLRDAAQRRFGDAERWGFETTIAAALSSRAERGIFSPRVRYP
jgi:hypothetical protein